MLGKEKADLSRRDGKLFTHQPPNPHPPTIKLKVELLGKALDVTADVGYTCETAGYFFGATVQPKWRAFQATLSKEPDPAAVARHFPFTDFFTDTPAPLFPPGAGREAHLDAAAGAWRHICGLFEELAECRAFELLRSSYDRGNFLLTKHAKVVAMTCTHAAIKRKDLVALAFQARPDIDCTFPSFTPPLPGTAPAALGTGPRRARFAGAAGIRPHLPPASLPQLEAIDCSIPSRSP
jgi:hypothetical protein